ncbi:MAG: hypothetical protein AAF926_00135 [Pseudomonadota bacterium]
MTRRTTHSQLKALSALQGLRQQIARQAKDQAVLRQAACVRDRDDAQAGFNGQIDAWTHFWASDDRDPQFLSFLADRIDHAQIRMDLAGLSLDEADEMLRQRASYYGGESLRAKDMERQKRQAARRCVDASEQVAIQDSTLREWSRL